MRARISSCVTIGRPKMRSMLSRSFVPGVQVNRGDETAGGVLTGQEPLILSMPNHPQNTLRSDQKRNATTLFPAQLHVREQILKLFAFSAHAARMDAIACPPWPDDQRRRETIGIKDRARARPLLQPWFNRPPWHHLYMNFLARTRPVHRRRHSRRHRDRRQR